MLGTTNSSYRHELMMKRISPITSAFYTSTYRDISISRSVCRSFAMSSSGRHILFASDSSVFLSSNFGLSFVEKTNVVASGTTTYQSLISDDGNYAILYSLSSTNTTGQYYLMSSSNGSFVSKNVTASNFTLVCMCMSSSGEYVFATGNGTSGGIYVSNNYDSTFVKSTTTNVSVKNCACTPDGKTVVVSSNSVRPYYSTNFGSTFATLGTTTYAGRAVYVRPDGNYFAVRCVSSDAVLCTNLLASQGTLTSTTYLTGSLVTEMSATQSNGGLDRNGRFYYIQSSTGALCYMNWNFSASNPVQTVSGVTFTDSRLCVSTDGKYLLGFSGTRLRLVKQFHESNTVTIVGTPSIDINNRISLSVSLSINQRPVSITWSSTTTTDQPQEIAAVATTPVNITLDAAFVDAEEYTLSIAALNEPGGFITGYTTTTLRSRVIPDKLAYWDFENRLTNVWTATTITLTDTNSNVAFSDISRVGSRSVTFDGSQGTSSVYCILVVPSINLGTATGLSFSFWFYKNATSIGDFFLFNLGYSLWSKMGNNHVMNWASTGAVSFPYQQWNHVVCTVSSTKVCNMWLNNTQVITNVATATAFPTSISGTIGGVPVNNVGYSLKGYIDDFRIYKRVLTAAQVDDLYNGVDL